MMMMLNVITYWHICECCVFYLLTKTGHWRLAARGASRTGDLYTNWRTAEIWKQNGCQVVKDYKKGLDLESEDVVGCQAWERKIVGGLAGLGLPGVELPWVSSVDEQAVK